MPRTLRPSSADKPRDEMFDKGRNVVFAVAERRHHHGIDIQAVVQVFAELAGFHHFNHVAVGGRNQTDIHFDGFPRTHGVNLAFLNGAQQLHLHVERQFRHFIEKQGAAVGFLKFAAMLAGGAGEGAFFVAKENGFNEIFRNGTAVDRHERAAGAFAFALDGAGNHFLADARFPFDQDGNIGLGAAAAEAQDIGHGGR